MGVLPCGGFNLSGTLRSGQIFRWREFEAGLWEGWIGPDRVRIGQQAGRLSFQGSSPRAVREYFSLDQDIPAITRRISVDPVIRQALRFHRGLTIIRQDLWECLATFILSANNNIVRLEGMLEHLALRHGGADATHPRFPRPNVLAGLTERQLRPCRLGYRAGYLRKTAREVASGRADLDAWRRLKDAELRERLLELPGVGEKVVECVMLFGYARASAFPVDVWIRRAMETWYFRGRKVTDRKIREFARRHFGPECGWAQQYLFCRARSVLR